MKKISEYKEQADACRKLARAARSLAHQEMLLDMAATWDRLARARAEHLERQEWLAQLETAGQRLKAHARDSVQK